MASLSQESTQRIDRKTAEDERLHVEIRLLGTFEVSVGERLIADGAWRLHKAAALVKLLALTPGHRLQRDQVLDLLWPDFDPQAAANNLHYVLYVARRLLGPSPDVLPLRDGIVSLAPQGGVLTDLEDLETRAAKARRTQDLADYQSALDLYRGDLLPQDLYEDWTSSRRESLRSLYLSLLLEVAQLLAERREIVVAVEALQRAIRTEPALEEAHAGLMRLYARQGQRQQALRQYQHLCQALGDLGLDPDATSRQLYQDIHAGRVPTGSGAGNPVVTTSGQQHNLPAPLTSFVGREKEAGEIRRLLRMGRLLTILGPGGVGKTRLALQVAREVVADHRDGVWMIDLASVDTPNLVIHGVARILGIAEQHGRPLIDGVVDALGPKDLLLVLDNCEHLIAASAELAETLLAACPRLKVLATSRETLGVAGETVEALAPLATPDPGQILGVDKLVHFDSARLLIERIQYRQPGFTLTAENARAVIQICRGVEGIPLAIELAAARVGALSVEQIATHLADQLGFLTQNSRSAPLRHRTMRRALDWSYELLDEPERALFQRLSVFAGGWTFEAAEVIGGGQEAGAEEVLDLLSRLVDKSLVMTAPGGQGVIRYRLLEPVRQYARDRLEASSEAETVHRHHAALFLLLAQRAELELWGAEQVAWLERLEGERDNLRSALAWSLDHDVELALLLAGALWRFWELRGHYSEGRAFLEGALDRGGGAPAALRAKALSGAGTMAWHQGDHRHAATLHEASRALYQEMGDERGVAFALNNLGVQAQNLGEDERAERLLEESQDLARRVGDRQTLAMALINLALLVLERGAFEQARIMFEEGLTVSRALHNTLFCLVGLQNLGEIAQSQGDWKQAEDLHRESLLLCWDLGSKGYLATCLEEMAGVCAMREKGDKAARLMGAAEALREAVNAPLPPQYRAQYYARTVAAVRGKLDEAAFEAAWKQGRDMMPEAAVEYALASNEAGWERSQPERSPVVDEVQRLLTPRERTIAWLVAEGPTNRQIAARLGIARRTVDTHVSRILKKLGLTSRVQLAAWIIQRQPPARPETAV